MSYAYSAMQDFLILACRKWASHPSIALYTQGSTAGTCNYVSPEKVAYKCSKASSAKQNRLCNCCSTDRRSERLDTPLVDQLTEQQFETGNQVLFYASGSDRMHEDIDFEASLGQQNHKRRSNIDIVTSSVVTDPCYLSAYVVGLLMVSVTAVLVMTEGIAHIDSAGIGDATTRLVGCRARRWQLLCSQAT